MYIYQIQTKWMSEKINSFLKFIVFNNVRSVESFDNKSSAYSWLAKSLRMSNGNACNPSKMAM